MNKTFLKNIVLLLVAMSFVALTVSQSLAESKFYVCLVNNTNKYINYNTEWCTSSGYNCTGYGGWTLAPGASRRHWAWGRGKMIVKIHTGGSRGVVRTYNLYGTTGGCRSSSTSYIRYNNRGFLRIYAY